MFCCRIRIFVIANILTGLSYMRGAFIHLLKIRIDPLSTAVTLTEVSTIRESAIGAHTMAVTGRSTAHRVHGCPLLDSLGG